jgi:glutamine amidotransferase
MIGVVDYEAGNIASISNALTTIGVEFIVSSETSKLDCCTGIILPGVGAASGAMASLQQNKMTEFLKHAPVPLLGICLGMQLLYESSEEGPTKCLGIVGGTVRKFDKRTSKIPHMGWNVVDQRSSIPLMEGIATKEYFYFAHSYYSPVDGMTTAITEEGIPFGSVIRSGVVMGVQFHPEKSGAVGLKLLKNFAGLCK